MRAVEKPAIVQYEEPSWRKICGLLILRGLIENGNCSAFDASYAWCFQAYTFSGLHKLDPNDSSMFHQNAKLQFIIGSWAVLTLNRAMTTRYTPSDRSREHNSPCRLWCSCSGGNEQTWLTHAKYDRILLGYCHWDIDRVAAFEVHQCVCCGHYLWPPPSLSWSGWERL